MSRNPNNAPAKSKSPIPFIIIGVVLVGVIAAVVLVSRQSASNSTPAQNASPSQTQAPRMPQQPGAANPYTRGNSSARVTLEEFSDFQCPACSGLEPGLRRVMKEYDDRVRFVFRNYPLQMHK
jgi:protein-disulfide isomerase